MNSPATRPVAASASAPASARFRGTGFPATLFDELTDQVALRREPGERPSCCVGQLATAHQSDAAAVDSGQQLITFVKPDLAPELCWQDEPSAVTEPDPIRLVGQHADMEHRSMLPHQGTVGPWPDWPPNRESASMKAARGALTGG